MVEPDVALTDFAIALACGVFVVVLLRGGRSGPVRLAFVALFAATGAAALVGGIAHGFFDLGIASPASRTLWLLTMAFTGAAGASLWLVVSALILPPRMHPQVRRVVIGEWLGYLAWVVWVDSSFIVAVVQYSVPAVALLLAFVRRYAKEQRLAFLMGSSALILTFVAGALQQAAYTPVDVLTPNAFFHILQLIALAGLFAAARRIGEVNDG